MWSTVQNMSWMVLSAATNKWASVRWAEQVLSCQLSYWHFWYQILEWKKGKHGEFFWMYTILWRKLRSRWKDKCLNITGNSCLKSNRGNWHFHKDNMWSLESRKAGPGFKSWPRDQLFWVGFFVVFVISSRWFWVSALKLGRDPFQILSNSLFTYHPFILCCIVLVTYKTLLNKLQIHNSLECRGDCK
jgi:hypothetical protein